MTHAGEGASIRSLPEDAPTGTGLSWLAEFLGARPKHGVEILAEMTERNLKDLLEQVGPYPLQAAHFIREGLSHTVKSVHGESEHTDEESRHVSGQQLCLGLRDFAIRQYGLLAKTVLHSWGIRSTEDFGKVVFAMIDAGFMRKTNEDNIEHFRSVFDFDEAFVDVARRVN